MSYTSPILSGRVLEARHEVEYPANSTPGRILTTVCPKAKSRGLEQITIVGNHLKGSLPRA